MLTTKIKNIIYIIIILCIKLFTWLFFFFNLTKILFLLQPLNLLILIFLLTFNLNLTYNLTNSSLNFINRFFFFKRNLKILINKPFQYLILRSNKIHHFYLIPHYYYHLNLYYLNTFLFYLKINLYIFSFLMMFYIIWYCYFIIYRFFLIINIIHFNLQI